MKMYFAVCAGVLLFGCASVQTPDQTAQELAKSQENEGILERSLAKCREQIPISGEWPTLYSIGFYGEFWVRPPMEGRVIEINRYGGPTEEQMFILPRAGANQGIKLEGEGAKLLEGAVYGIVLYRPPQDEEARKKPQSLVIEFEEHRFVFIFKRKRF